MEEFKIVQINVRHSAAAQAHIFNTYKPDPTTVYLLQEPNLRDGKLVGLPAGFIAAHSSNWKQARTAVVASRAIMPVGTSIKPHSHYTEVLLGKPDAIVASGYCPPKGDIVDQLRLFPSAATLRQRQWRVFGIDTNAYHEAWGSRNSGHKTESRHSKQWRRGQQFLQWTVASGGCILTSDQAQTYCSDLGTQTAIDVTVRWGDPNCYDMQWTVARSSHVTDHYPIYVVVRKRTATKWS